MNTLIDLPIRSDISSNKETSQWSIIDGLLEEARVMNENQIDKEETFFGSIENYNLIKKSILRGIETGEFDPQYSVDVVVGMIIVLCEGVRGVDNQVISLEQQINHIRNLLKEILIVLQT